MAKKTQFLKGSPLAAYARKKATSLGLDGKGMKLADLVWMIQEKDARFPRMICRLFDYLRIMLLML